MGIITVEEAQRRLPELVRNLAAEGELLITDADRPVAQLVAAERASLRNLQPASVGRVLRSFPVPADDILGEMLNPE